jgi:hypothetical protein
MYGKRHGAFRLDVRDSEVLFCISNVLNAGIAPEETLDALFGASQVLLDRSFANGGRSVRAGLPLFWLFDCRLNRTGSGRPAVGIPRAMRMRHLGHARR